MKRYAYTLTIRPKAGLKGAYTDMKQMDVLLDGEPIKGCRAIEIHPIDFSKGGLVGVTLHLSVEPDWDIPVELNEEAA